LKKILYSLLSIGAVALVAVAATGAFFSDTETSVDNTFIAGELDLQIDSECQYYQNDLPVGCFQTFPSPTPPIAFGNWSLGNLTTEKFFDFLDVKPGDYGENTISLHVFDNDAWVCMDIENMENDDNTCTEPEDGVDELGIPNPTPGACGTDPNGGELAQNLNFFAWLDEGATDGFQGQGQDPTEGDNEWQDGPEPPLFSNVIGPASDVLNGVTYTLADSNFSVIGGPFIGSTTYYIGVTWCAGTLSVDVPDVDNDNMTGQPFLDCDGEAMVNDTQSDSLVADLTFRAEQWRNNPTFTCED